MGQTIVAVDEDRRTGRWLERRCVGVRLRRDELRRCIALCVVQPDLSAHRRVREQRSAVRRPGDHLEPSRERFDQRPGVRSVDRRNDDARRGVLLRRPSQEGDALPIGRHLGERIEVGPGHDRL